VLEVFHAHFSCVICAEFRFNNLICNIIKPTNQMIPMKMMNKLYLLCMAFLFLLATPVISQTFSEINRYTINGMLTDKESGEAHHQWRVRLLYSLFEQLCYNNCQIAGINENVYQNLTRLSF
jgi:hypothetical protein